MSEKKLFLLDAYALAYRSYYAFIKNPRINSKGFNTSAIFGFTNVLLEVLNKQKPSHIGVVFDPSGPTFRHEMYEPYKANREAMPDDLRQSIPLIKQMIEAMNIPVVEVKGFEADDVVGTLAHQAEREDFKVYMMTPDKDYAQLVTDNVFVFKPARGGNEPEIWDPEKVVEKFKVKPESIVDLLGLMGDSSDNIPGCPGVGPKGAEILITSFGSIEGVYENIDKLKGKQKENMVNFKEQIELSKVLATIDTKVPVAFDAETYKIETPNENKITSLFEELEFRTLINRVLEKVIETKTVTKQVGPVQGSLFDMPTQDISKPNDELKSIVSENPNYKLAQTDEEIADLVSILLAEKEVCFDTETTSLTIHSAELVGMSFSIKKGVAWFVPVANDKDEAQAIVEKFRPFFEAETIAKIGQNIKYDISVLKNYNMEVKGSFFDTMIAHYLVQPELRHNLDILAKTYLNYRTITTEELIGKKGKNQKNMRDVELNLLKDYACEDADITFQLAELIKKDLNKAEMLDLYKNIEAPLINILAAMEYEGIKLDKLAMDDYAIVLKDEIAKIQKRIFDLAGEEFNIASPKQMGEVLFERMKIIPNPKMTKTKQYATGEDVLSKLTDKHDIIKEILDFRTLSKLLSTYVEALPQLIHTKTGKIHTSYNQTITATGRLSSNNPNLQNIPIRDNRGKAIRKAFVPSDNDHVLFAADYSQIELRLMAHLSDDKHMIEAFANNEDIHASTAARILKKDKKEVSREDRSMAKGANFGIIYGISSFGLAQNLNISRKDAKALIDSYFEIYPDVKTFMDDSIKKVRENGYAETFFGRRRYLADIQSSNAIVRSAAERNAINAPIQGTAADVIKIAMINVQKRLKREGLKSKMILQVHDELVFDALKTELDNLKTIVVEEMEGAAQLKVPLTVDSGVGENWLEAH
ncbi:MAG: DNA polymerase I [Salinivirgaceae bacterium]|jgi:DNA polymerase-1|nr:DNA polymerase I [Salinivirgaceae bacterium]